MQERATTIERPSDAVIRQLAMERMGRSQPKLAPFGMGSGFGFGWRASGNGVPTDGPSSWYRPTSAAHFTALGLNTPDILLLCQEASGNLVPAIDGLSAGNWTAGAGGPLYQQNVTGWSSFFVGADGVTNNQRFAQNTANGALDLATDESFAMLVYCSFSTPAVTASIFSCQGTGNRANIITTDKIRFVHESVNGTTAANHTGLSTVHMVGWWRRGDLGTAGGDTDLESVSNTYSGLAQSTTTHCIGANTTSSASVEARYNWAAIWKGTNANFSMASYIATLMN